MFRRLFAYGLLAVIGIGVVSMAGVLRNRGTVDVVVDVSVPDQQTEEGTGACCAEAVETCTAASSCCTGTKCRPAQPAGLCVLNDPAGTAIDCESDDDAVTIVGINGVAPVQSEDGVYMFANPPPSELAGRVCGPGSVDGHLHAVRSLLAAELNLSPSQSQLKAAIDSYLLSTQVETAIATLSKVVEEAPESPQGKRARAAIDTLQGNSSPQPVYEKPKADDPLTEIEQVDSF